MKKTYYMLSNKSMSVGQYLMDEDYLYLNPECQVVLERRPTNWTENITFSIFKKEVPEQQIEIESGKLDTKSSKAKQGNKKKGE